MSGVRDASCRSDAFPFGKCKIKICGLKRPEDIRAVNEAKPDYCGFVIEVPKSSRCVSRDQVRELTAMLDEKILPVGVFVNAPEVLVAQLLNEGTIAMAQLHGQEDDTYIRRLRETTDSGIFHSIVGRCGTGGKQHGGLYFAGSGRRRHWKNI